MGNLFFCLNYYNDINVIKECLDSIKAFCPDSKIVAVDGAYQAFIQAAKFEAAKAVQRRQGALAETFSRFMTPESTDGSTEIVKQYADIFIPAAKDGWETEHDKRSEYFVGGQPGDMFFVIDADEVLQFPRPVTAQEFLDSHQSSPHWCITLKRDDDISPYSIFRIHRRHEKMEYKGAHHAIHCNDILIRKADYEDKVTNMVKIFHRWAHRASTDPSRHLVKGAYYRHLLAHVEKDFRANNNV